MNKSAYSISSLSIHHLKRSDFNYYFISKNLFPLEPFPSRLLIPSPLPVLLPHLVHHSSFSYDMVYLEFKTCRTPFSWKKFFFFCPNDALNNCYFFFYLSFLKCQNVQSPRKSQITSFPSILMSPFHPALKAAVGLLTYFHIA